MLKASRHPQGVVNTDQASTSSLKQISFCKIKAYLNKILHFESHLSKLLCSDKISVATFNRCYLSTIYYFAYLQVNVHYYTLPKQNKQTIATHVLSQMTIKSQ